MLNNNNKPLGSMSLIELVYQPIHEVLAFIDEHPPALRESMGHAVALACYLELSN